MGVDEWPWGGEVRPQSQLVLEAMRACSEMCMQALHRPSPHLRILSRSHAYQEGDACWDNPPAPASR